MPNQIEAILFDFGGTLRRTIQRKDSEKIEINQQILEMIGQPGDPADFTRVLSDRSKAYQEWAESESTELNEVDLWTRWMLPDFPAEKIGSFAVRLNQVWRDSIGVRKMIPEAQRTLLDLFRRGYRLGLVSNTTSSTEVPRHLEELGLAGCFDTIILSCQVGMRKPDPSILLEATRRMDIHPKHCAYIGNHPERDVVAARGAGFSTTVILRDLDNPRVFNRAPELTPDHFIDNLHELLELFPSRKNTKSSASNGRVFDASLSSMWGIKKFSEFGDFFLAADRLGFAGIELNHQVSPRMLAGVDLNCYRFKSIHEPCPAVISADDLKKQDLLISSPNEERRREGVNSIKRSIDLAKTLGSEVVVVHCGQVQGDWSVEREMIALLENGQAGSQEYQEMKKRFEKQRAALVDPYLDALQLSLSDLLDYAGGLGVRLGIENRYHYPDIPTQDEMSGILGLASPERLGFIFDVGHAYTQDHFGFYPYDEWLKRFESRIIGTHLHDVIGIHDHLAPGLGNVDFGTVASYLPKDAFRTLEVKSSNTPEQIKAGIKILVDTGCVKMIE